MSTALVMLIMVIALLAGCLISWALGVWLRASEGNVDNICKACRGPIGQDPCWIHWYNDVTNSVTVDGPYCDRVCIPTINRLA